MVVLLYEAIYNKVRYAQNYLKRSKERGDTIITTFRDLQMKIVVSLPYFHIFKALEMVTSKPPHCTKWNQYEKIGAADVKG